MRLIVVNFFVFICLLVAVEGAFSLLNGSSSRKGPSIHEEFSEEFHELDPVLGFRAKKDMETRHLKKLGEDLIYDVTYRFDSFHRRVGDNPPLGKKEKFIVLVGDSNIFGEGLRYEQTTGHHLQKLHPKYRVYNYPYRGYGPGNVLALLESDRLREEIAEEEGLVIYPFLGHEAERLLGSIGLFRWSLGDHPYYRWGSDKRLHRDGTFRSAQPWLTKIKRWIARSQAFRWLKRDFPDPWSVSSMEKICSSFIQMESRLESLFPQSQFVVVISETNKMKQKSLTECLENQKLTFLDISGVWKKLKGKGELHERDSHFDEEMNVLRANQTSQELMARGLIQ